jgi:hypothetical protein
MYIYCATPYGKLKSNFIKIGFCTDWISLNKRYGTYYGTSFRSHYVKVEDKSSENIVHEKLKVLGLHLENELFIYDDIHDFYFYVQVLNNFKNDDYKDIINYDNIYLGLDQNNEDNLIYNYKHYHIFEFFIYISNKNINKKIFTKEKINKNWKYHELTESNIYYDGSFDNIWKNYLLYCNTQLEQHYKIKSKLKEFIQSIFNKKIMYENYLFEIKEKYVKIVLKCEIEFKKYIFGKYDIIMDSMQNEKFEMYLDKNINMSEKELINMLNNISYYFPYIDIYKIKIKDLNINDINKQLIKYINLFDQVKKWNKIQKNRRKKQRQLINKKMLSNDIKLELNEEQYQFDKYKNITNTVVKYLKTNKVINRHLVFCIIAAMDEAIKEMSDTDDMYDIIQINIYNEINKIIKKLKFTNQNKYEKFIEIYSYYIKSIDEYVVNFNKYKI